MLRPLNEIAPRLFGFVAIIGATVLGLRLAGYETGWGIVCLAASFPASLVWRRRPRQPVNAP